MAGVANWARGTEALAVALGMMAVGSGSAAASETHVFDPTLSLTGDCTVSTVDTVPDPGCPGGTHPPSGAFAKPRSEATDPYGNIYVANSALSVVDIFSPAGVFVTELRASSVQEIAVDHQGHLYAYGQPGGEATVVRYDPESAHYKPSASEIAYEEPVTVLDGSTDFLFSVQNGIAVDSNGHLYVDLLDNVNEYGSAAEGNKLLDSTIGQGTLKNSKWVTVDSRNGDIYASDSEAVGSPSVIRVFGGGVGHPLERTISGFGTLTGRVSPAVDESTGHVFVDDLEVRKKVYEFPESSGDQTVSDSIAVLQHEFRYISISQVAVDNGESSPNQGYLFVPSEGKTPPDHLFAFEPLPIVEPPIVESVSVSNVTETEAKLEATIDPNGGSTKYRFEYVAQSVFEESGFVEAIVGAEGELSIGDVASSVSAPVSDLSPDATYQVRVIATNDAGTDEGEAVFKTFAAVGTVEPCPNDPVRLGLSSGLADCRAFELVTPADTGGHAPRTIGIGTGDLFGTPSATAGGTNVGFLVDGGGIPGTEDSGAEQGDGYVARRLATGWKAFSVGPSGTQSSNPFAGGLSPDHSFAAWVTGSDDLGELPVEEDNTHYVRYPDGSYRLVGRGSIGTDPRAVARSITAGGSHIIFETQQFGPITAVQLEPQAPADGTAALYDRTGDEVTHVVSLLPGEVTPEAGEDASYEGSSTDGSAVAFKLGNLLTSPFYLRVKDEKTILVSESPGVEFAGLSEEGRYLFYVRNGNLFRLDDESESTDQITSTNDAVPVNVSADGSHAYFTSESVLTGEEENNNGRKAVAGEQNLYLWDGVSTSFVASVTDRDVEGESVGTGFLIDGLGLWNSGVTTGTTATDPSRTTKSGRVFLFESRAQLTGYDSGGKAEIYRFDVSTGDLRCLSCSPNNSPALGDASLQSVGTEGSDKPTTAFALIPNLSADGKRAFFETNDALMLADTDRTKDVYEWEESGIGSCEDSSGCVYLISSGHSARPNYLYGGSSSGDDVFFSTSDQLVGADLDATRSIYDARVGGGFVEPEGTICGSEECRGTPETAPTLASPNSPALGQPANVNGSGRAGKKCAKGMRKVKRHGKTRCVRNRHRHRRHHSTAGGNR